MPPRPPPSPPVLTVVCSLAAVAATWLCLGLDQLGRGLAGRTLGIEMTGWDISLASRYIPLLSQGPFAGLGAWGWLYMILAGPLLVVLAALLFHVLVLATGGRGLLRGFSLAWLVVALLWLPAALIVAALPGGAGPVAELYQRLGAPRAGRWTAAALGLLLLGLVAGPLTSRAVAIGRAWMRADAVEFRRRLVRVTAGWPGVIALAGLTYGAGWDATPWSGVLLVAVLVAFQYRTN